MTEFTSKTYNGQTEFEVIIRTYSVEHYKAAEGFARKLIDHAKPQTNGDRIRAMSDEEFAKWIDDMYCQCVWCDVKKVDCSDTECTDCIVAWLQQPVEEEPGND